jgi:hypothetical protein
VKGRSKVKIALDASLTPYDAHNISRRDIARARELAGANFGMLMQWWIEYNG